MEMKRVAIVGNADSLSNKRYGNEIDEHDIVVRINRGISCIFDYSQILSRGKSVDVWAFNLYNRGIQNLHSRLVANKIKCKLLQTSYIDDRKHFIEYYKDIEDLKEMLHPYKPSTGMRVVKYFLDTPNVKINLYGFDWKETPTFYDINADDSSHDYIKEKSWFKTLEEKEKIVIYK